MGAEQTRAALLDAAAELIVEVGWGEVVTRDIAQRAGVPHGAVSYHFDGKAELLREAALRAVERLMTVPALTHLHQGASLASAVVRTYEDIKDVSARELARPLTLLAECLVRATRDEVLRDGLSGHLREYRRQLAERARADIEDGRLPRGLSADGVAMVVSAAIDGLLLHAAADPQFDYEQAYRTLAALLSTRSTD